MKAFTANYPQHLDSFLKTTSIGDNIHLALHRSTNYQRAQDINAHIYHNRHILTDGSIYLAESRFNRPRDLFQSHPLTMHGYSIRRLYHNYFHFPYMYLLGRRLDQHSSESKVLYPIHCHNCATPNA
jgi:hypothetical protein